MTTRNVEHEFFTKVKGWEAGDHILDTGGSVRARFNWKDSNGVGRNTLPPISTSWDAFHEWVVPEFYKRFDSDLARMKIGDFFYREKTPQRALEWAMEELGR